MNVDTALAAIPPPPAHETHIATSHLISDLKILICWNVEQVGGVPGTNGRRRSFLCTVSPFSDKFSQGRAVFSVFVEKQWTELAACS